MTYDIDLLFPPKRVKYIRTLLGLTQVQFAQRIGVEPDMVRRWEGGKSQPMRARVLKALLEAERGIDGG